MCCISKRLCFQSSTERLWSDSWLVQRWLSLFLFIRLLLLLHNHETAYTRIQKQPGSRPILQQQQRNVLHCHAPLCCKQAKLCCSCSIAGCTRICWYLYGCHIMRDAMLCTIYILANMYVCNLLYNVIHWRLYICIWVVVHIYSRLHPYIVICARGYCLEQTDFARSGRK